MDASAARIQWQRLAVFGGAVRAGAGGQRLAAGIVDAYDAFGHDSGSDSVWRGVKGWQ